MMIHDSPSARSIRVTLVATSRVSRLIYGRDIQSSRPHSPMSDPAGSRTTRVNNASVLHSAFEFLAIVCGFDLKIVGHRDGAELSEWSPTDRLSGHSGNPALRRPSSYLARSSGRRNGAATLARLASRKVGRSRA